jgi:hypothetical protein
MSKAINDLTAERVREALDYDPRTGILRWKIKPAARVTIGDIAGGKNGQGYLAFHFEGKHRQAHRIVWLHVYGKWPDGFIDHINGDPSDNRIANLRDVNEAQNGFNRKTYVTNTSGFKGVSFHKRDQRYIAYIYVRGTRRELGAFDTAEEAHKAYMVAAAKSFGEYMRRA